MKKVFCFCVKVMQYVEYYVCRAADMNYKHFYVLYNENDAEDDR